MSAPAFALPLEPVTVGENESARFRAHFSGFPAPLARWFRYGQELRNSRDVFIETSEDGGSSTLVIIRAHPDDSAGVYTCMLENAAGAAKSSANLVVVAEEEREYFVASSSVVTTSNKTVEQSTTSSSTYQATASSSSSFQAASSSSSSNSNVREIEVDEGDTLRIDIQFKAGSRDQLRFEKDGKRVGGGGSGKDNSSRVEFEGDVATLVVENARAKEDSGSYACVMETAGGEATVKVNCTVRPRK